MVMDEGPPEGVAHGLVAGLVVQPLLEQEDGEGGEEEDDGADVGGGEQLLPVEVHHVREHQPHLPSPVDPIKHRAIPSFWISTHLNTRHIWRIRKSAVKTTGRFGRDEAP